MENILEKLKNVLPEVKENVELKDYSTFRIGGSAKYFIIVKNQIELKTTVQTAIELGIKFFVLGGGSNTLIDSAGFDGLVIVYKNNPDLKDFIFEEVDNQIIAEVSACWPLSFLVLATAENNLSGLEWGVTIPGTVGGAINGNAGAFKKTIGERIVEINLLEIKNNLVEEKIFSNRDCKFEYRNSIFKSNPNLIILSAKIKFEAGEKEKIKNQIAENLVVRKNKHPNGFSIGSIFKNYRSSIPEKIIDQFPILSEYLSKGSVPAWYFIEQCGLKGVSVGGAMISSEHANFIINANNATSEDVLALVVMIKREVEDKFQIILQEEIKIF